MDFNAKNWFKFILFFFVGALVCFITLKLILFYRTTDLADYYCNNVNEHFNGPTQEEVIVHNKIFKLFKSGEYESINKIINIEKGEVELTIVGAKSFPATQTPIAEIAIVNISDRILTFFEPSLQKLNTESYYYNNMIQYDYTIDFPIIFSNRCHILEHGKKFSIPVLFNVSESGVYKINITLGFPKINELSKNSLKYYSTTIQHSYYIFEKE